MIQPFRGRSRGVGLLPTSSVFAMCLFLAVQVLSAAEVRDLTIGVVTDGKSPYFEDLLQNVKSELKVLEGKEYKFTFKDTPNFCGNWETPRIQKALQNAMNDKDVDIVLTMGVIGTAAAAGDMSLDKPVIGGCFQDAETAGLPYDTGGRSTKSNFNFVVTPLKSTDDIKTFNDMIGFKRIHILLDSLLYELFKKEVDEAVKMGRKKYGVKSVIVPVAAKARPILKSIKKDVEAVYFTPLVRMDPAEKLALIRGLNGRSIPTFSMNGHSDVELGVLAGLAPEMTTRMSRRIALNIQQIAMGTPAKELPVHMPVEPQLCINGETAVAIGYSPDYRIMLTAEFINMDQLDAGRPLSLQSAVDIALQNNIDAAIKKAEVDASRNSRNSVMTSMLPQVDGNAQYYRVDEDRAENSGGAQPREKTTLGVEVSQMIFNDELISSYRGVALGYESTIFDQKTTSLDIVESVTKSYLAYLSVVAQFKIDMDNLKLTRSNLDLARVRHKVGTSGPEEVYRWEAQEAQQKSSLIDTEASVKQALIALNQVLGLASAGPWKPENIVLEDGDLWFLGLKSGAMINNDREFDRFMDFSMLVGMRNSPELLSLDKAIEAQSVSLGQLKRRFVLPSLNASFTFDHEMESEYVGLQPGQDPKTGVDDDEWMLGVSATLPLFYSGGRVFDVLNGSATFRQLQAQREKTRQLLEQRIRNSVVALGASFPSIELNRTAADMANKNLNVIHDKYARGLVSILDLLDAQNQAFSQKTAAAIAVYTYLEDLMEYQRSIGWFEYTASESEKEEWRRFMTDFVTGKPGVTDKKTSEKGK